MKVLHSWLKDYLGENIPSPEKIEELLTFHTFEIEEVDGEIIDIDVLPNRSSDCLSHRGIAREIATLLDVELQNDPLRKEVELPTTDKLKIDLLDIDSTKRLSLALIENVKVGPSPDWLKSRLEALGQRSINNVVDATNYVMLSLGQPLHAYDADKFKSKDGEWTFGVRFAEDGEKITTLTGEEYELTNQVQLIVNETDGAIASIAGIKGGKYAEVDENTTNVILEAGNFDGVVTRLSSQYLKLQTDASKRFENNISPEITMFALREIVELTNKIAGGTLVGVKDTYPNAALLPLVDVQLDNINRLLGLDLSADEVEKILERTGSDVARGGDVFRVTGPFERTDLNIEADYIEEVGRIYGYSHVASVVPEAVHLDEVNKHHYYSEKIREILMNEGFSEVITSSFRKKDSIRLQNALASDKGCLRSTLSKNLMEVLDKNFPSADLLGVDDIRVFEIGTVFEKSEEGVMEHNSLALGVRLKAAGYSGKEDKVIDDVLSKLAEVLGSEVDWQTEKGVAETNLTSLISKLPFPKNYEPLVKSEDVAYKPFSVYPTSSRDIAMWVGEGTSAAEVEKLLMENSGELCVKIRHIDEFTKEGRTSHAFRLVFQAPDRTLTDEEVTGVMDKLYELASEQGWEVR